MNPSSDSSMQTSVESLHSELQSQSVPQSMTSPGAKSSPETRVPYRHEVSAAPVPSQPQPVSPSLNTHSAEHSPSFGSLPLRQKPLHGSGVASGSQKEPRGRPDGLASA